MSFRSTDTCNLPRCIRSSAKHPAPERPPEQQFDVRWTRLIPDQPSPHAVNLPHRLATPHRQTLPQSRGLRPKCRPSARHPRENLLINVMRSEHERMRAERHFRVHSVCHLDIRGPAPAGKPRHGTAPAGGWRRYVVSESAPVRRLRGASCGPGPASRSSGTSARAPRPGRCSAPSREPAGAAYCRSCAHAHPAALGRV